ncbi:T9SS type A sorting domain-containing protein [Carboxylicivirga marina]|uniref:T9SS type A sorting domain-containing protein n=1 Tax=Carboxylicivirga marina TaxID=2800988 RepID=UPI002598E354|nr:T9SS type A sorting domain-containing protein [uncultured Carboxylicivirga sp.]
MKAKLLFIMLVSLGLSINAIAQIKNGDMETIGNPTWPWNLSINNTNTTTPGAATQTYEAYSDPSTGHFLQVVVTAANTEQPWNLRVKQNNVAVGASDTKIIFKARGTVGGELLKIRCNIDGTNRSQADFTLTTSWTEYELILDEILKGKANELSFWTQSVGTYQFDDVVLSSTPTAISDDVMAGVKVWYIASDNTLNIDGITANTVSVYSLSGAKVAEYSAPGSVLTLGNIPSGIYVVSVATDAGTKMVKIKK